MNITQLRQFTTVARLGSMSRATQLLHFTQSALSENVTQLERGAPRMLHDIIKIRTAVRKAPPEDR